MTPTGSMRGRHGIGAVLALISVLVAFGFDVGTTYDNGPSALVWALTPLLVGVGASFSTRWSLVALAASVGVHAWFAERRVEAEGLDPLAGLIYAYPSGIGVLGLVALLIGTLVGRVQRRRHDAGQAPISSGSGHAA